MTKRALSLVLSLLIASAQANLNWTAPQRLAPQGGKGRPIHPSGQLPRRLGQHPAGQADTARIRGAIAATPKTATAAKTGNTQSSQPATLVVNGVSMPLSSNEDGSFGPPLHLPLRQQQPRSARPSGQTRRVQFYQQAGNETRPQLRIVPPGIPTTPTSTCTSSPRRRTRLVRQPRPQQRRRPGYGRHHRLRPLKSSPAPAPYPASIWCM